MKIIPLGTKGYIPTYGRHTMSFLVFNDKHLFILDAGTGLSRLFEDNIQKVINKYEEISIILSHYHLDHIVGLPYLASIKTKFKLYVPSKPFVESDGNVAIENFLSPPFFSLEIKDFPSCAGVEKIENSQLEIYGHKFEFIPLFHHGGSMGIKIDNTISYITDTVLDKSIEEFVKGCNVVLLEVWMTESEVPMKPNDAKRHTVYENVIEMLEKSNIKKLIPIHLNPAWDDEKIKDIFTQKISNKIDIVIPQEGETIEF